MRNSSRAERRHHVQRLKRNRRNYWSYPRGHNYASDGSPLAPEAITDKHLGMVVHTPQLCSCPGCGNSRRHVWFKGDRKTVQEKRQFEQYREQLLDSEKEEQ